MYSKFTTITPKEAVVWLDTKNAHNRPISQSTVERYTQEIRANRWKANGQSICVGRSGNLLNGQHRLTALVAANTSIECLVVWGVEDSAFDTIDDGNKRSLADVFAVSKELHPALLSAGVRFLWVYATGQIATRDLRRGTIATKPIFEDTLKKHPGLRQSTKFYSLIKSRPGGLLIPAGMAIGLHYLFALVNDKKADEFFDALQSGIGLMEGHSILMLRARLIAGQSSSKRLTNSAIYFYTVTTWNAFIENEPMRRLVFVQYEILLRPRIENIPEEELMKELF